MHGRRGRCVSDETGTDLAVVVVSATRDWTTTLEPRYVLVAPIIGAATGLVAGLQPAWRASHITPATALRTE